MKRVVVSLLAGSMTLAAVAAAEAPTVRRLKHDPFDWSALQQASERKEPEPVAPEANPAPPRLPRLKALMHWPSGARVDLEGAILDIGESAGGYRLIAVRERSAVFSKDGKTVEIELSGEKTP